VCGSRNDFDLSPEGFIASIQSSPQFKRNKVCYYTISGPLDAKEGDLLYLKVIQKNQVNAVIAMAIDRNDQTPKIVCNVQAS
jgi:hypothetical protein